MERNRTAVRFNVCPTQFNPQQHMIFWALLIRILAVANHQRAWTWRHSSCIHSTVAQYSGWQRRPQDRLKHCFGRMKREKKGEGRDNCIISFVYSIKLRWQGNHWRKCSKLLHGKHCTVAPVSFSIQESLSTYQNIFQCSCS